jgi:ribosomal protein S6--L-glutamate ligase
MVMEVNSSPGLEGIQKATGEDVADAVIEHLERELPGAAHGEVAAAGKNGAPQRRRPRKSE